MYFRNIYIRGLKPVKLKVADKFKKPSAKDNLKIWPKCYKRFSVSNEEENFKVEPQKHNYKLLLISIGILLILWLVFIRPIEKIKAPHSTPDKSIAVQLSDNNAAETSDGEETR